MEAKYVGILDCGALEVVAQQPPQALRALRPAYQGQVFDDIRLLPSVEETPGVTLYRITMQDALLSFLPGAEGVVATADGRLVRETTFFTDVGCTQSMIESAAEAQEVPQALLHTTDAWASNYFHWLCVALGKSLLAREVVGPEVARVLPEFRRESVLATPGYSETVRAETLKRFAGERPQVTLGPGLFRVPELHMLWSDHGQLEWHTLLPAFYEPFQAAAAGVRRGRTNKVLLVRRDDPRMSASEQADVLRIGQRFGYGPVQLEDATFEDELKLFSEATHVAGPHGAGLANLVFCQAGTRVLELNKCLDGVGALRPWFMLLANGAGHEYRYLNRLKGDFTTAKLEGAFAAMEA